jgi:hypothetical protein
LERHKYGELSYRRVKIARNQKKMAVMNLFAWPWVEKIGSAGQPVITAAFDEHMLHATDYGQVCVILGAAESGDQVATLNGEEVSTIARIPKERLLRRSERLTSSNWLKVKICYLRTVLDQ